MTPHRSVAATSFKESDYTPDSEHNDKKFSEADILIVDQTSGVLVKDSIIKIYQIEHRSNGTYLKDITLNLNGTRE